jgi:hypothetical protein
MRLSPLALLALVCLCALPAAAQQPAATVRGVVIDSLAGAPLAEATVQLIDSGTRTAVARTTTSDAAGRFSFADVADGQYVIGFLHPVLDTLGLEPILRAVTVAGGREVTADLAIPAPARLRGAFCGENASGGAIVGFVRAAAGGAPVQGASVVGEWMEISVSSQGLGRRTAQRVATSGAGGEFRLCDVPSPGTVFLSVTRGDESTDRIELDVPEHGFLRRSVYVGEVRTAMRADTVPGDSVQPVRRTGPGRLSGTVVASDGGRPLPGARVRVVNGDAVQANASGEWTLTGAPSGTRQIEIRATGFYPVRRVVDIAEGTPPVRVTLSRLAAVLDTIRATARSQSTRVRMSGFNERRQSLGVGRFLSADDIQKRRLIYTSDLFNNLPGLLRIRDVTGDEGFYMRSPFGNPCVPTVYVDGQVMPNLGASDLDTFVNPQELAGIEVYTESQAPPQFQPALSGCGSIVVWTK